MRPQTLPDRRRHERLCAIALLWLLAGGILLLSTLVPARTPSLGWAPTLWLVVTPMAMLLALEPSLPRRLLAPARARRSGYRRRH